MGNRRIPMIEVIERDKRIEEMVVSGVTNHYELAAAFGMERRAVTKVIAKIYESWRESSPTADEKRELRQRQFENIYRLALQGYVKSALRVVGTKKVEEECTFCFGLGQIEEAPRKFHECAVCGGSGVNEREVPAYEERTGDPAFLRLAKDALGELSKFEGSAPSPATISNQTFIQNAKILGGPIQAQMEEIYAELPEDTLVRALNLISDLRSSENKKHEETKASVRVIGQEEDDDDDEAG